MCFTNIIFKMIKMWALTWMFSAKSDVHFYKKKLTFPLSTLVGNENVKPIFNFNIISVIFLVSRNS